ncbi:NAD-P-binding protein [Stereum hirsutum FP-91666 SS1]|uniref:NAD-P-binding protein n=1 Tax=Stereum hirsutum (strain FP-91666) TaxID=721885 RepID=UPI00044495BC|nr:NAD-P-binding protein [Stereum hirsutum FP-91666 SS1]EIM82500.1 NAD-P-binding protein [Stereum hirsutum FP-91666 SS1]
MPSIGPTGTILITGASGFSGAWVSRACLEAGFYVRGTVRTEAKGQFLQQLFSEFSDRFSTVIIDDISKPGAFDTVLNGVQGVIHIAGLTSQNQGSQILLANLDGVKNLVESIRVHGIDVKRIVYMSSARALLDVKTTQLDRSYNEGDWNNFAVEAYMEKGEEADSTTLYAASKVLSERYLLDFVRDYQVPWDVVNILPTWVVGPVMQECNSLEALNFSNRQFYKWLTTAPKKDTLTQYAFDYIDVRDMAEAFVNALRVEEAGNERFIVDADAVTLQNLYDEVHAQGSDMPQVPVGEPDAPKFSFPGPFASSEKAKTVLRLGDFRGLGTISRDFMASLREKGLC